MKEIGGYFGLEELSKNELYSSLIAVNNGRNALVYILRARKIKKIYIPYFLCDSISLVCEREGVLFEYYYIDKFFLPIFNKILEKDEYIYLVNYFGIIDNNQVKKLKNKFHNIIWDNAHAFFQSPVDGVDTVYTCRKFFGVPDGGYVSTEVCLDESLETDISKERMKHILGRYEGCASDFYTDFKENDSKFKILPLRHMSKLTKNILSAIDYSNVKRKREENYCYLHSELSESNGLNLKMIEGPYAYPFYFENGMIIKKRLAEKSIYVATLWPNVLKMEDSIEKDYAENILPLPCDQRYGFDDMKRIVQEVKRCIDIQ